MRRYMGVPSVLAALVALILGVGSLILTASPAAAATVTSFTPTCGPVGTVVTITGTGFVGVDGVIFNGTPATTWSVVNETTATAEVPVGAVTGYVLVSTPGSDVSSSTSFRVTDGACGQQHGEHHRSITLALTNRLVAKGRLTVDDPFIACRQDATVHIQRSVHGAWTTVGTDVTTGVGNYRVHIPDKSGKYRASVAKTESDDGQDVCLAVTSKVVPYQR